MKWLVTALLLVATGLAGWAWRERVEWVARSEYRGLREYRIGLGLPLANWIGMRMASRGVMSQEGRAYPRKVQVVLWDKVVTGCRQYTDPVSKRVLMRGMAVHKVTETEIMVYVYTAPEALAGKDAGGETARYVEECLARAQGKSLPEEAEVTSSGWGSLAQYLPMRIEYVQE